MKRILTLLTCIISFPVFACTTFCIKKNGQIVFGRNYDWVSGAGIVNTNQRGLIKTSINTGDGNTISWVSTYGSISFNQYGKEFPTGGMNEKGLVVELMWLDGTVYPATDDRPALGVLQWIQYQLDNAANIDDVINSDRKIRISKKATPLHYLIADAVGNTASIEFLDGKMTVHKDNELPYPVLTNNTYESSVKLARSIIGENKNIQTSDNSLDRFVTACGMIKKFNESEVNMPINDFAFSVLDKVSQGSFTKWSIVYDISQKKIHFITETNRNIRSIDFSTFDFNCNAVPKMFDMNKQVSGDVNRYFITPDQKLKRQIMDQVVAESRDRVSMSKKQSDELLAFEETTSCK